MRLPFITTRWALVVWSCSAVSLAVFAADESETPSAISIVRQSIVKPGPLTSPDRKYTVLAKDNSACIIDVAAEMPAGPWLVHSDSGRKAKRAILWAFSPNGKYVATAFSADTVGGGDSAGDVRVWEVPSGKPIAHRDWATTGYVRALLFSENSRVLFIQSDNQSGK